MTLRRDKDEHGAKLVFTPPWSPDDADEISRSGINRLVVVRAPNLNFLEQAPPLEVVQVMDLQLKDVSGIHAQAELKWLDLNAYFATPVDFSVFRNLERLHLDWGPGAESVVSLTRLRRLSINRYPATDLTGIGAHPGLRRLRLSDARRLQSLDGLDRFTSIEDIRLLALTNLEDLGALSTVAVTLDELELDTCKRIGTLDWFTPLIHLRVLSILNCGKVPSLKPIEGLLELQVFLFYESTNVLDGDLTPLLRLPNLKDTSFQDRRHYSHRRDEVLAQLAVRSNQS